ncbi:hypothetical protein SCHPADRAFT_944492 [Schizopora paradoxa]|uniref:BTB domain-containing protein n=1 Tax=Schizopora paradoxa TaxID=27342 RepID=A0A0H2R9B9_9AGAM|nr:hypothetical protein SCHPADRAFT_944492 [Schizopora paradoxa]
MDVDVGAEPPMIPARHETLWFPGGDIVLATNTFLFKVHKDLLALQSSVFKDMFGLEQAVEDVQGILQLGDSYEGLPAVALAGDEGKDVAHLLQAAYYREYYDRDNDETPLEVIVALLVLSNKYDFKHIQSEVMKQLSRLYPRKLDAFDEVDDNGYYDDLFGTGRIWCEYRLLKACLMTNTTVLLPLLYYACAFLGVDEIYVEADRAGGLDRDYLRTLIGGKFQVDLASRKLVASLPDEFYSISCSSCKVSTRFSKLDEQIAPHLWSYRGNTLASSVLVGSCKVCSARLESRIDEKREEIWEKIPSYFGFPGWDEL